MASFRITFIGDSLVAGTGDQDYLGWPGRICKAARARGHEVTCYNLGIRGNTSADILARWRREAEARDVASDDCRLIFSFGVNDTKDVDGVRLVAPEMAIDQARAILRAASAYRKTLMIGPPPIGEAWRNERIASLSESLSIVSGELDVPYFDSFASLSRIPAWRDAVMAGDGVHPIAAGYDSWARAIEAWPAWQDWAPG